MLAHTLPPEGTGGATEFADSRTAYEDLPEELKSRIEGLVANHSLFHSRKTGMSLLSLVVDQPSIQRQRAAVPAFAGPFFIPRILNLVSLR